MRNSNLVQLCDWILVSHLQLWDTLPLLSAHPSSRHPLLDTIHPTQATTPYQSTQDTEACPTPLHLRTNTLQLVSYFIWHLVDYWLKTWTFGMRFEQKQILWLSCHQNVMEENLHNPYSCQLPVSFWLVPDWTKAVAKYLCFRVLKSKNTRGGKSCAFSLEHIL